MLRQALTTSQSSFLLLVLLFPFLFLFLLFLLFLASHQHQYLEPDGLWQPVWSNEYSWLSGPDGCLTDLKMGPEWRRVDREQMDFKGRKKTTKNPARSSFINWLWMFLRLVVLYLQTFWMMHKVKSASEFVYQLMFTGSLPADVSLCKKNQKTEVVEVKGQTNGLMLENGNKYLLQLHFSESLPKV